MCLYTFAQQIKQASFNLSHIYSLRTKNGWLK